MRCENRLKGIPVNLERAIARLRLTTAEYLAARKPIDKVTGETLQKERCKVTPVKWSAPKKDVVSPAL